jgi:hypothetical protein
MSQVKSRPRRIINLHPIHIFSGGLRSYVGENPSEEKGETEKAFQDDNTNETTSLPVPSRQCSQSNVARIGECKIFDPL